MKTIVLYSGGKDSSLAAIILKNLGYEVELVTANFGALESWKHARDAARVIGFKHRVETFDRRIAEEAAEKIISDGFPNKGIQFIHHRVLIELAKKHKVIADGTRRDDRVPMLDFEEIRSLEDRYGVEYISPLRGLGYKTLNRLVGNLFQVSKEKNSDYEVEIKELIRQRGEEPKKFFPKEHQQSRVVALR